MSSPPTPIPGHQLPVNTNASWQLGLAPRPAVQIQGVGGDTLLSQVQYRPGAAHTPQVDTAWLQVTWMNLYLLPTGEFPGNGTSNVAGNNFFDMINGMASFTRGTRAIQQASLWNSLYAGKVASQTAVYDQVCQWLLSSPTKAQGDGYDANNLHRYYMAATTFRNTAYLLRVAGGATNLAHAATYEAAALDYENQALAQQKGPGWMLALYPPYASGQVRASILYLPPSPPPAYFDGTVSSSQIYGEGVRPEQGDGPVNRTWDAIYNPNGDKLAVWALQTIAPGDAHRTALSRAVDVNLFCAMQFLTAARDPQGAPIIITANGSCRVGNLDIYGNPKKIEPTAWRDIFKQQAGLVMPVTATDWKYTGSSDPAARAVFASVYTWLDNVIRNPSATIPAPPVCPTALYPTVAPVVNAVTKTLRATGPGGTTVAQITVMHS